MKISELYNKVLENNSTENMHQVEEPGQNLLEGYREWRYDDEIWDCRNNIEIPTILSAERGNLEPAYQKALNILQDIQYDENSLKMYIGKLQTELRDEAQKYPDIADAVGLFTSAAINNCQKEEIDISGIEGIERLGYKNKKDLTIHGDVPQANVGEKMKKGKIKIKGKFDSVGDQMKGGQIQVEHDSPLLTIIGSRMEGGSIKVKGGAGRVAKNMNDGYIEVIGDTRDVGPGMKGGKVKIEGSVEDVAPETIDGRIMEGGNILIDGEIENLHEQNVEGTVHQKQDGEYVQVASGD
jgi:formylmethanofuran dehydrogenase subunit C